MDRCSRAKYQEEAAEFEVVKLAVRMSQSHLSVLIYPGVGLITVIVKTSGPPTRPSVRYFLTLGIPADGDSSLESTADPGDASCTARTVQLCKASRVSDNVVIAKSRSPTGRQKALSAQHQHVYLLANACSLETIR